MIISKFHICLVLTLLFQNAISFALVGDNHSQNVTDTSVIATVGTYKITLKEFRESYEFGPSFVKKFENPKLTHLQYMINEKLIALDGYDNGINNQNSVTKILKEVEDDIIVTEWYRNNISTLAVVDSLLIQRGIEHSAVGLTFRYIFTDNESDLKDIKTLLDRGNSFDSLYTKLKLNSNFFVDEVPTDFFTLFEDNPGVAEKLAVVKPGSCSDIIQTKDGFYLIRLDKAKKDFIVTPNEYRRMWEKVEKYYTKKILDSLTVIYIRGIMEQCPPRISGDALKKIFNLLSKLNIQSQPTNKGENTIAINYNSEVILDEDPGSEILVSSECDRFTIKDFIEWYSYRDFKIDFSKQTTSTLNLVKDVLFKMVRDNRVIKIARSQGYANDANVQFEVREWRDKLTYWKQKSIAIDNTLQTEEEVQKYYQENKIKYLKDTLSTYEQLKNQIRNDLIINKYNEKLRQYLNKLVEKYPVKINIEILTNTHLSDENLSKKINMVIQKKGGTLPRQAFPTIDNEWRYY